MPKLGTFSGQAVCDILRAHGFRKLRQRGSHIIMGRSDGSHDSVIVVVPDHRQVDRGTLSGIIRQSGLPRHEFEV